MVTKTKSIKTKQMACMSLQLVINFEIWKQNKKIMVYMMGVKTFGKDKLLASFEIEVPECETSAPVMVKFVMGVRNGKFWAKF